MGMSLAAMKSKAPALQLIKLWYALKGSGTLRRVRMSLVGGSGEAQGPH